MVRLDVCAVPSVGVEDGRVAAAAGQLPRWPVSREVARQSHGPRPVGVVAVARAQLAMAVGTL